MANILAHASLKKIKKKNKKERGKKKQVERPAKRQRRLNLRSAAGVLIHTVDGVKVELVDPGRKVLRGDLGHSSEKIVFLQERQSSWYQSEISW